MNHVNNDEEDKKIVETYAIKHQDRSPVICYAAKLKDYPGKFLPKVAKSLGVPAGPMFRFLKNGQTLTLPNGKEVSCYENLFCHPGSQKRPISKIGILKSNLFLPRIG